MEKNYILFGLFLFSLITFAQSQNDTHTAPSTDCHHRLKYDSWFMEKFVIENPPPSLDWMYRMEAPPHLNICRGSNMEYFVTSAL